MEFKGSTPLCVLRPHKRRKHYETMKLENLTFDSNETESSHGLKTPRTSIFFRSRSAWFSYDTSFLKRKQTVISGDVESNPGPTDDIKKTPVKGKGRPKGTNKKSKGFKGTPKKSRLGEKFALKSRNLIE